MKYKILFFVLLFLCPRWGEAALLDAENIDWSQKGHLNFRFYQDTVENNEFEDEQGLEAWFDWDQRIDFKEYDFSLNFDVGGRSETFINGDTSSRADLYFREAYGTLQKEGYRLSVGPQIVTWGKLDDVAVLDRINPQDLRRFILDDKEERKLSTWMVKYELFHESWQLETLYLPFFRRADIEYFGNDWGVFDHLKEGVAGSNYSASVKNTVSQISIEEEDAATDRSLSNGQGAFRLRGRKGDVDFGLYYMSLLNAVPALQEKTSGGNTVKKFLYQPTADNLAALASAGLNAEELVLEEKHPRTHIFGVDGETVWANCGLRGEVAYAKDQPFLRDDFSYVEKDVLSVGVGVDHTFENNVYMDFQIIEDVVMDYEGLFAQEENSYQLTGTLSKSFMRGKLFLDLDWACRPSYGDWMLNPEISYRFPHSVKVSLGALIFSGDASTLLGRYATQDIIFVEVNYSF